MGHWLELANRLEMGKDAGDNRDDRDKRVSEEANVPNVSNVLPPLAHNLLSEWTKGIASLNPDIPCGSYPPARWRQFIGDCHKVLDGFAMDAASIGWTAIDLFGVAREGACYQHPSGGLAWRLHGGNVIKIDADRALYRLPLPGGNSSCAKGFLNRLCNPFVPVWELQP
ncbi:MAG: hypothetical protein E2598_12620 [Sphingobium sp.]|nr:hypothetical protein [Sphingobium sp.]